MDQPIPAADLKQGAVTIDPDNRSVYSGILYQSPRDVLNPPKLMTDEFLRNSLFKLNSITGALERLSMINSGRLHSIQIANDLYCIRA